MIILVARLLGAARGLLRASGTARIDRAYTRAFARMPLGTPDEWGILEDFVDAAARVR